MPAVAGLSNIAELLSQKYSERGRAAAERLRSWMSGSLPFTYPEILEKHLDEQHLGLLYDCFWQILPFGTGGRRGRVGYGANRLNPATTALTVQGHCDWLRNLYPGKKLTVVVANDVRVFNDFAGTYKFLGDKHPLLGLSSRSLSKLACEIYAGNGITAYCAEPEKDFAVLSTPELSYLIEKLDTAGGLNLSASHNPPDDNGLKVYDEYGSQPIAPADQRAVEAMEAVSKVNSIPFAEALAEGLVQPIPRDLHHEYVQGYVRLYDNIFQPRANIPVCYTPLCGVGLTTVGDVFHQLKFPIVTPPDQKPDGSFAAIPFRAPNPEVPQATAPAKAFADENGSGVVLSSDPDADRVGLEVKLDDGSWIHFDGNMIAAVLCYFLMLDQHGPRRRGLVLETLVTTKILSKIVDKAGDSWLIDDLLVGFKYVADVLKKLGQHGHYGKIKSSPDQLVLATEESHGVIMIPTIRDKDATPACMYLAALYQRLKTEGRTLFDYYIQILDDLGPFADTSRSIMMIGAEGIFKRDQMMESLRKEPLDNIAGAKLKRVADHWDEKEFGPFVSETDKLPRNVIQYFFDTFIVTVRPSGTEPKLKFYCQLVPDPELAGTRGRQRLAAISDKAEKMAMVVYRELCRRAGVTLNEVGLRLPDIVDVGRKQEFETRTVPKFREAITRGTVHSLDEALSWLKKEAASMTPGADPLPALKEPLKFLCAQWSKESPSPLLNDLQQWASK